MHNIKVRSLIQPRVGALLLAIFASLTVTLAVAYGINDYDYRGDGVWPAYRFDLGRTAYNKDEQILVPWTVSHLKLAWTFNTKGTADSSPAVFDDIAYFGSDTGFLFAVDTRSGHKLWSAPNATGENTSPAANKYAVYMIGANMIRARDRITGALLWESPILKNPFNLSSPIVDEDSHHWQIPRGSDEGHQQSTRASDFVVYAGGDDGLYAFDGKTGAQLWKFSTPASVGASPAIDGENIYVSTGATVYAIDARTHVAKWSYTTGAASFFVQSTAAVDNGLVYLTVGGALHAIDQHTGKLRWKAINSGFGFSSPGVARGLVYAGSTADHSLHAFDARTGVERWSFETEANIAFSSASVAGGVVYTGSYDGRIYALDAESGAKLWDFTTGGIIEGSPTVVNGMLYIPSNDYFMYAFSLKGKASPAPLPNGCQTFNGVYLPHEGAPFGIPGICRFPYTSGMTYSGEGNFKITCSQSGGPFTTVGYNLPLTGCAGTVSVFAFGAGGGAGFPGGGTVVAGDISPDAVPGACDAACLELARERILAAEALRPADGQIPAP